MMAGVPPQDPAQANPMIAGQTFQQPSPEALNFVHKLLASGEHSANITHVSIHPAHKAKHKHLMNKKKGK